MANTFATENLAAGQLPAVLAAIFTSPPNTRSYVKNIVLVNRDTLNRTLNLYRNNGSTSVLITPMNHILGGGNRTSFEDENFTLGPGESIEGECDVAAMVDYLIEGVKET